MVVMYHSPNRQWRGGGRLEDPVPVPMWAAEDAVPTFVVDGSSCITSTAYPLVTRSLGNISEDNIGSRVV